MGQGGLLIALSLLGFVVGWAWHHKVLVGLTILAAVAYGQGPWWLAGFAGVVGVLWWSGLSGRAQRQVDRYGGGGWLVLVVAGMAGWWLLVHPFVGLVAAGSVFFGFTVGPVGVAGWWLFLGCVVWAWHDFHPSSFHRVVAVRWWSTWRELLIKARWRRVMLAARLGGMLDGREVLPTPVRVRSSRYRDDVTVQLPPAQTAEYWAKRTQELADGFAVRACQIHPSLNRKGLPEPGHVLVRLLRGDPLADVVPPLPIPASADEVDLSAVPIGRADDGDLLRVRVQRSHALIAGASDAGKSGDVWSLLAGMAPCIAEGSVEPWGIDPKGNELAVGEELFARYAYPKADRDGRVTEESVRPMVDLVIDAAELAVMRGEAMHGKTRQHVPTPADPLVVLVIDEIVFFAEMSAWPELRKQFFGALKVVLSQGRSAGVVAVVESQDTRKEVLPSRHMFGERVLHRCLEADEVKQVLGDGARDRGARCDEIPVAAPGVGYHIRDGRREPTRFRTAYWDDTAIRHLAETYPPPANRRTINTLAVDQDEDPFDHIGAVA